MKNLIYIFAIIIFAASCSPANHAPDKKEAEAKERMNQFFEQVVNAHNVDMIDSFCTTDFINHNPDPGHSGQGIDDLKATFREFFAGFPDVRMTPNFMIAEGDKVMAHITMTGTNTGAMGNMPPTGKSFSIEGIDIITIKDGKAAERWGFFDNMKMMTQLGMMPEPGAMPDSAMMKMEGEKK